MQIIEGEDGEEIKTVQEMKMMILEFKKVILVKKGFTRTTT